MLQKMPQAPTFVSGCIGSEGSPPVGSMTKPLLGDYGTSRGKRGSSDQGQSPLKLKGLLF